MKNLFSSQSGVALLMSLGVLVLLAVLAAAFATDMRLIERTTRDFDYEEMARGLAEAGIQDAIDKLKDDARTKFVFEGIDQFDENLEDMEGNVDGEYVVTIIDTASQININTANRDLLECIPGIGPGKAQAIINRRNSMPNGTFLTKQSICLTERDEDGAGVGENLFNNIKDLITTDVYIDPNVLDTGGNVVSPGRSAININGLIYTLNQDEPREGAEDMLENMFKAVSDIGDTLAGRIIAVLKAPQNLPDPYTLPIESWDEFNKIVDQASGIGPTLLDRINSTFNPNRAKPSSNYTTEFCFHSGGIYEITSVGTLTNEAEQVVAEKTITAIVKIFDLWNQSTTQQFWGEDINNNGVLDLGEDTNNNGTLDTPNYTDIKVIGLDSCPVRSDDNWNGTATTDANYTQSTQYYTTPGSLKIGYWDDFTARSDIAPWDDQESNPITMTNFNGEANMPKYGQIILGYNNNDWKFGHCSITVLSEEQRDPPNEGTISARPDIEAETSYHVGWCVFRYMTSSIEDAYSEIYVKKIIDEAGDEITYPTPISPFVHTLRASGVEDDINNWGDPPYDTNFNTTKCYRILQYYDGGTGENVEFYTVTGNSDTTNFFLERSKSNLNRYQSDGWAKLSSTTGLEGWPPPSPNGTHWDNLRIISDTGEYTSTPSDQAYNPLTLPDDVEWGMVWGTVTRPDSVQNPADVDVKIEIPVGSTEVDFTDGVSISAANPTSIQYKLNFDSIYDSSTNKYSETPVLEDVWITYLPGTQILYWREGAE